MNKWNNNNNSKLRKNKTIELLQNMIYWQILQNNILQERRSTWAKFPLTKVLWVPYGTPLDYWMVGVLFPKNICDWLKTMKSHEPFKTQQNTHETQYKNIKTSSSKLANTTNIGR